MEGASRNAMNTPQAGLFISEKLVQILTYFFHGFHLNRLQICLFFLHFFLNLLSHIPTFKKQIYVIYSHDKEVLKICILQGVGGSCAEHLTVESYTIIIPLQSYLLSYLLLVFHHPLTLSL